ncbi:VUT family protein [Rickettsiales endosymbiont of Peranema trichophorum]|uniref:queuosine precursor transporter n=1 Tax=Rickettsiales endosymbiont of Peranema trichophorum TaxID=2486577 RepID=UPI001022E5F6|nr:queuosine precursor transporter [Rickettsiales endosymbiont of Peranema trichophorum]RZI47335.1 VUT family protein [Rickettsiales endosymbiont of Peranema trichophorum]
MQITEKVYTALCVLFSSLIVFGNLTYQKIVIIEVFSLFQFQLSVGAILYPWTFLITDLITEFYSKDKAMFCVRSAIATSFIVAILLAVMDALPATSWSKLDDALFHKVFGGYVPCFISSVIACYTSQAIDIRLYLLIRQITGGKYLWLRNNCSTCISLFIDTSVIIVLLGAFGIVPFEQVPVLIYNSYSWKLFFTISSTPIFYVGVYAIRYMFNKRSEQQTIS